MTGLWKNPDFLKLWSAQAISELGSRITREGVPLTAVIVLLATPAQMGLLGALGAASALLFALLAGVWVDRLHRRPILIASDLGRAALLATIPIAAALGALQMWQLYTVTALTGILTVFFDVAYQSYLPSLVETGQVLEGNSKLAMSSAAAEIAGPGLTGFLVQWITAPAAILFDSISFLISAALVASIRRREAVVEKAGVVARSEMLAGMKILWNQPILRALAARAVFANLFAGFLGPLYILYAIRTLGMSAGTLGIVIATGGVGYMIGSIYAERIAKRFGVGPAFIGSAVGTGVAWILIPLAHGPLPLITQQLLGDGCGAIYTVHEVSLRQSLVEDRYLGRVNAAMQMMARGMWPIGMLAGGALGGWIGLRPTMAIAAAGLLLSCLWLVFSPVRNLLR